MVDTPASPFYSSKYCKMTMTILNYNKEHFSYSIKQTFSKQRNVDTGMVLIQDGNLGIGAHVQCNLCYLICVRHLIRSRAVTNRNFFPNTSIFIHSCAIYSELLFNIKNMDIEVNILYIDNFYSYFIEFSIMPLILDGNSEQLHTHEGK